MLPGTGFRELQRLAEENNFSDSERMGSIETRDIMQDYIAKCLSFVDIAKLQPLRIVINPNFGSACLSLQALRTKVPFEAIAINAEADGTFPKGRPDPLREETREETIALIKREKPSFGVAWDGDGDRCFFYDENGRFVDSYYIVSILARYFLQKYPQSPIIYDTRSWWATADTVTSMGGQPIREKVGHVFFKGAMREHDAPYGGEMSAHHHFRDYFYCDNGLIPFLILWQMVAQGQKLSDLVRPFHEKYPISGEINFTVKNVTESLQKIEHAYPGERLDHFDGLLIDHDREWRASIRGSNNEPLLRLNIEAKTTALVDQKVAEISAIITTTK